MIKHIKSIVVSIALFAASVTSVVASEVNVESAGLIAVLGTRHVVFTVEGTNGSGPCSTEGQQIGVNAAFIEGQGSTPEETSEIIDAYLGTLTTAQVTGKQVSVQIADTTSCTGITAIRLLN